MLTDDFERLSKDLPLSKETERLLDRRYESFLEDPNQGRPWDEVKKEIRESL